MGGIVPVCVQFYTWYVLGSLSEVALGIVRGQHNDCVEDAGPNGSWDSSVTKK